MPQLRLFQIIALVTGLSFAIAAGNPAMAGGVGKTDGAYGPNQKSQKIDKSKTQMKSQKVTPKQAPAAAGNTK